MDINYLNFSVEELADDREFIAWVVQGKNKTAWELFLAEYPDFRFTATRARKIIEILLDHQEKLSSDDILEIWKNIEEIDKFNHSPKHKFRINIILRYAAILFLVLSIGSAGYWYSSQKQKFYVYKSNSDSETGNQSYLFLSNGTKIDLEKKDSKIAMNSDQTILINDEKKIDMGKKAGSDESEMNEVVIPYGKKSSLLLEDGTKVWLNAGSRMAFPTKFKGNKREVFLEGEAYFEVAHNEKIPFIVNTDGIDVRVLGTKFNISAYKSDNLLETVLVDGKIAIKEKSLLSFLKNEIILIPHEKASFDRSDGSISVQNFPDVDYATSWTYGWLKFSRQNLNIVLQKLQRYYDVQFEYGQAISSTDLITGKLDLKENITQVMEAVADVADLHYEINGSNIYINKN